MRHLLAPLIFALGLGTSLPAQTCTGLCLQQVSCPGGGTTSITGTIYTPNGTDPLPNVLVYIPNAPVDTFTAGVSCPVPGKPPSGSPLVGSKTAVDGTFTLTDVPVGANIPLVIQSGKWRRQVVVPATTACANTAFSTRMPRNQAEGDIPKFAIATGSADKVECVLRKVGIDDKEFTNSAGSGRINLYSGSGSPGARVDPTTPSQDVLMNDLPTLSSYDVLMLPCQGRAFTQRPAALDNFIQFANTGGRVYSSHFSYVWMYQNPPLSTVVNWDVNQRTLPDGIATVDTSFAQGQILSDWLQLTGASTTPGQIPIFALKHDLDGVVAPTQSWLALNNASVNNPVMQFVFDAPVGAKSNQCGRVLFNEYHVSTEATSPSNIAFPAECTTGPMTPQEKLLEFSLFNLTDDGGTAVLSPTSQDFGSQPVGFPTAPQIFTWTNNSTFSAAVTQASATGDFSVTSNNCAKVSSGGSCQIAVVFTPTALGARTGTLNVASSAGALTASLTGTGTPDLTITPASLDFGNLDVGASLSKSVTVTNIAPGSVALPALATSGDFAATTNCGASIAARATCTITVTFTPTATGPRTGSLTTNSGAPAVFGLPVALTGNGVDFTIAVSPTSGTAIAGYNALTTATATPIAGFASRISLTCTTNAAASLCTPTTASFLLSSPVATAVNIATTSKSTIIGYGGFGVGNFSLWLAALASACFLWRTRRTSSRLIQTSLTALLLTACAWSFTGCSGQQPATRGQSTVPGSYTYTVTATDGFLTHSATYTLQVTAK